MTSDSSEKCINCSKKCINHRKVDPTIEAFQGLICVLLVTLTVIFSLFAVLAVFWDDMYIYSTNNPGRIEQIGDASQPYYAARSFSNCTWEYDQECSREISACSRLGDCIKGYVQCQKLHCQDFNTSVNAS